MIKNVKFVVSCQNVNTHAVSTLRSNAEQLPSCEWTAYEILSTIACSFFRLASMKKIFCLASAVEPWGNIADELKKSSSRFNSRPGYEQGLIFGNPRIIPSKAIYHFVQTGGVFSVFYSPCRWYSDTVKSAIYQKRII